MSELEQPEQPPESEGGLCGAALRKLRLQRAYRVLEFFQAPFGFLFWEFEKRKARIDLELERTAS